MVIPLAITHPDLCHYRGAWDACDKGGRSPKAEPLHGDASKGRYFEAAELLENMRSALATNAAGESNDPATPEEPRDACPGGCHPKHTQHRALLRSDQFAELWDQNHEFGHCDAFDGASLPSRPPLRAHRVAVAGHGLYPGQLRRPTSRAPKPCSRWSAR